MSRLLVFALLSGCSADLTVEGTPWPIPDHPFVLDAQRVDLSSVTDDGVVTLELDLFDAPVTARLRRRTDSPDGTTWDGRIDGDGSAILVHRDGAWAGTIRTVDRLIRIGMAGEDAVATWVDEGAMPMDLEPIAVPTVGALDLPGSSPRPNNTRADVLVAYTREAVDGAGGLAALRALTSLAVTETNQGLASSGLPHEIRVVHTAEVSGVELGTRWADMLDKLRSDGDGFADEVHALRDAHGADHVVLLVDESSACGIAYVMTEVDPRFQASAFSVVSTQCATGYYSFGHELGHNMGSAHHKSYGEEAAYAWAYGHRDPDDAFRTIMAYNCAGGCPRVNRWSDPNALYEGRPLGAAGTGMDASNNVRTLQDVRAVVEDFRPTVEDGPTPATLVAPTSTTIEGGLAMVQWQGADDTPVRVTAGSVPGGADFADAVSDHGSHLVTGLPVDGAPVWIRLWTPVDGGWHTEDTRFDTAPADTPAWVVPVAGGSLEATEAVLAWSNADRPRYRVSVGTRPATSDILDVVTTRSVLEARGLPAGPVYLSLGWEDGEDWTWVQTTATVTP